ncbi:MAG: permease [Gemmatimonadaceae bacterium]
MSFAMFWEILWPLILGFTISGIIQAVVSKRQMVKLMGDDRPKTLAVACSLGAASSSCSYAAVAIARSVFKKGGNFTAAMAFELASTNLVLELGIILIVLMGWQFALAEFTGGPLMVVFLAFLFRRFLSKRQVDEAREQADKGVAGKMEGHADMHMEVEGGSVWSRIASAKGFTAISHFFVMDWVSVWKDIALGLLIAGAVTMWVPSTFWNAFFLTGHPLLAKLWGPVIGPLISVVSFVCSVGNVPLAAALWNGGISFGGVIAFIFADLIIIPILNIYRKYYGRRMMAFLFVTFYAAMAGAALVVEFVFQALGLIPSTRHAQVAETSITFNYTTVLNIIFLLIAAVLIVRFLKTGGPAMLRMMSEPMGEGMDMSHEHAAEHAGMGHVHGGDATHHAGHHM